MANFIPNENKRFVPRDPPWITKALKTMLNRKNGLFKDYKKHGYKLEDKARFDTFRTYWKISYWKIITVSPRFSPRGLIAHKTFLPGGLIEGGGLNRGEGLFISDYFLMGAYHIGLSMNGGLIEIICFSSHKKFTK